MIALKETIRRSNLCTINDISRRYTNLKTLFLHPYMESKVTSQITEASIQAYVDESCVKSCLVFVDGIMSPSLSKTSAIPKEVIACSIASLNAAQFEEIEVNSMLDYIPDVKELPRNSYASDVITVLNSVSQDPHNTDIVSIDPSSESLLSSL